MIEKICRDLAKQCRWFDIIHTSGSSIPIQFKNNRLHSVQEKENSGFGVRVNIKNRTGFSYTNSSGRLPQAAGRAVSMAPYGDEEIFDLPEQCSADFEPYGNTIDEFNIDREISNAESVIDLILSRFPQAVVDVGITKSSGSMRLINSQGLDASYRHSLYSAGISLTHVTEKGSKIDVWEGTSSTHCVDYVSLAERIIERTTLALAERGCASGKIPVLFTPKAVARLMGIVASGFNAKAVWKGISPFADKRDTKIFNEKMNIHDDPSVPGSPYSYPFDDEGVIAVRKPLIENGVICNFITDLKHAHKLNIKPLGNGSRGYASLPFPSFSNIEIDAGTEPVKAMLESINQGILIDQFIGLGQSNTLTGDISANLDLAFLIEKGEITGRVKDCMISDNLFSLLNGDIVLSEEREQVGSALVPYMLLTGVSYTGIFQ